MTLILQLIKPPKAAGDYRAVWVGAFLIAILFAPYVVLFRETAPWLIAIPIVLGCLAVIAYEMRNSGFWQREESEHLETMEAEHEGLKRYDRLLSLDVRPPSKVPRNQLALFPGFEQATPHNSVRMLLDSHNNEIPTVSCERYSALLVSYMMSNVDKATDKALSAAVKRFCKMGRSATEIHLVLDNQIYRDIIKADVRGNLLTQISKGGEKVAKDLLKAVQEAREKEESPEKAQIEKSGA
jgi:hypothetical protein